MADGICAPGRAPMGEKAANALNTDSVRPGFTDAAFYSFLTLRPANGGREEPRLNPRLVICLLGAMVAGLSAAGAALAVNAGPVLALFIYSGVGSTTLVTLTLAWPERRPALVGPIDGPALA